MPPETGGFAGAGAAGQQHDLVACCHTDGFPLLRGVGDTLFPLYPVDEGVQIFGYQRLPLAQFQNTVDDVRLVLEEVSLR